MAGPVKPDVQKELRNLRQRFSALENMLAGQDPAGGQPTPEIDLNAVVSDLTYSLITSNATLAGIADIVLNYAKVFTNSEYGYVSAIDPETGDNLCHTLTGMMGDSCQITQYEKGIVFPKRPDGQYPALWGHCLNTRTAFFTNAPAAHPSAIGMPDGHIPLFNFLSVPAIIGGQLFGQISLANAEVQLVMHIQLAPVKSHKGQRFNRDLRRFRTSLNTARDARVVLVTVLQGGAVGLFRILQQPARGDRLQVIR